MADGRHIENRLGYNWAADCQISGILCVGKQFTQTFGNETDSRVPQNVFFAFLTRFGLRRAADFVPLRVLF